MTHYRDGVPVWKCRKCKRLMPQDMTNHAEVFDRGLTRGHLRCLDVLDCEANSKSIAKAIE